MNQIVKYIGIAILGIIILTSCGENGLTDNDTEITQLVADITQLTDEQYPDNNDIESRSELWNVYEHAKVEVLRKSEKDFTIVFFPTNDKRYQYFWLTYISEKNKFKTFIEIHLIIMFRLKNNVSF